MANVKKVDYAGIIWEDIVWHIQHKSTNIPFIRFTKLLIESFLREYDDIPQRLDDEDKNTFRNEDTLKQIKRLDTSTRKQGKKLPDCLLNDKVKNCKNYKYYVQALKEDKVGFLDEVILPSFMQKKGKKGSKSGSSESSTKSAQKPKKGTLKFKIPVKKPVPEPIPKPTPPSSPKPSDSETESDSCPVYREAYAHNEQDANIGDLEDLDISFEDWDRNIDEFVEQAENQTTFIQRPLTEADAKMEEERLRGEKMKEPMTAEQVILEEAHSNIGLSVDEQK